MIDSLKASRVSRLISIDIERGEKESWNMKRILSLMTEDIIFKSLPIGFTTYDSTHAEWQIWS